MISLNNRK